MPKLDIETETFPRGEYPELPSEHADDFFAKLDPKIPHRYYNPADDRKNELGEICDSYSRPAVKDKLIRAFSRLCN